MKNLKHLLGGALLLALPLFLTSCNDIIGDLDNPISSPSTPSAPAIKYLVWNTSTEQLEEKELPSDYTSMTATTTEWKGNYIVDSDIDIVSDVTISGDVNIILKDGKTLNVHGKVAGDYKLCIFALSSDAATAGTFDVAPEAAGSGSALAVKELEIHGGNIIAGGHGNSSGAGDDGIKTTGKLYIYAGTVEATGGAGAGASNKGGNGIEAKDKIYIYTGKVTATGGASESGNGGIGLYSNDYIHIYVAEVTATGGSSNSTSGGIGIKAGGDNTYYPLTIEGGTVKAIGGDCSNAKGAYGVGCKTDVKSGKLYAHGGKNYGGTPDSYGIYGPLAWSTGLSTDAGTTEEYGTNITSGMAGSIDGIKYRYVRVK